MRNNLENLMYLVFSLAALPFTWLGLSNLFWYLANPELLEVRDAALEVLPVFPAISIMGVLLILGLALALYLFIVGPRFTRVCATVIIVMWVLPFVLTPATPFQSFARLYWDSLPFALLFLLPWVCWGLTRRSSGTSQKRAAP